MRRLPMFENLRSQIIEPGTYLSGFRDDSGQLYFLYRCPECWHQWYGVPHGQKQTAYGEAAILQCPNCNRFFRCISADSDAYTQKKISTEVSVLRRRRISRRTKIPGGLFDGISGEPADRTGTSEGPSNMGNLRR